MIGRSIYEILSSSPAITALVGNRIGPIKSEQAANFPCLYYATDNIAPIRCRRSGGQYEGTVEISMLARTPAEIDQLTGVVRLILDNSRHTTADYYLNIDAGTSAPDDEEDAIFYRRLDFSVSVQRR